ncbi:MAG TPA: methyltransferase domain-containing protein [Stellaceae bacterium]|nr:methyltransferase domain-containing protein [Stellaceae bacterium]
MRKGLVTDFDGRYVSGWVDRESRISVFVDDISVRTGIKLKYTDEVRHFIVDIDAAGPHDETPKIVIKFAGTDIPVPVGAPLEGVVNPVDDPLRESLPQYIGNIVDLPCPPQEFLDYIGSGAAGRRGFLQVGAINLVELLYFGMIPRGDRRILVDLGCGCGRTALALAPVLKPGDAYVGYDTWHKGIEWATEHLSSRYPTLHFFAFPADNRARRGGYQADHTYPVDLADNTADTVTANSLFTHLRLPAATTYLREIYRVLKPGGRAFLTWFLSFDGHPYVEATFDSAQKTDDGYFVTDEGYVDAYLFEDKVLQAARDAGFTLLVKRYGGWPGPERARHARQMQDLLVLLKPVSVPADGWKFSTAQAYREAANELEQAGDAARARALLAEAELQFPNDPFVYIRRSYAIMAEDRQAAAVRWATCRLRFPEYADGWIHGALLLEHLGQRDAGVALLDEALPRFASDIRVLMPRAYLAAGQRQWDQARQFWQRVLDHAPDNEEARREYQNALARMENA